MSAKVYVAGLGVICAIGNNVAECLSPVEDERAGINDITYLKTVHAREMPAAEIKLSNEALADIAGLSPKLSRTVLLSMIAAEEALEDASIENIGELRTGFISANTVGGIDKTEKYFESFFRHHIPGDLHDVVYHECWSVTELVADKLN